jgi:predicted secreted protein
MSSRPTDPGISGAGVTLTHCGFESTDQQIDVGYITKVGIPGLSLNPIDVTNAMSDDQWKQFIAGFKDAKSIQADLVYKPDGTVMADLLTNFGVMLSWSIVFPGGAGFVCDGFLTDIGVAIPAEDKITQSITIKLTGVPDFAADAVADSGI